MDFADQPPCEAIVYWYRLRVDVGLGPPHCAPPLRIEFAGTTPHQTALTSLGDGENGVRITYRIGPQACIVRLEVLDIAGRAMRLLDGGHREPGSYAATWNRCDANGRCVARGVYLVRLTAGAPS